MLFLTVTFKYNHFLESWVIVDPLSAPRKRDLWYWLLIEEEDFAHIELRLDYVCYVIKTSG